VFPVYDIDISRTASELTHFAVVFSNIVEATTTANFSSLESRDISCCASIGSYTICSEDFIALTATARLSDTLKFLMICKDALVITDINGRIVHINKSWQEVYGYSLCEVESLLLLDVVTRQKHNQETITSVFNASKTFQCTSNHCRKYGEDFPCTLILTPLQGTIKLSGIFKMIYYFCTSSYRYNILNLDCYFHLFRNNPFCCPSTACD
jgi:PAS domain S-box-containing protein